MVSLWKVCYIVWNKDVLQSGGLENTRCKNVQAKTQRDAAIALRKSVSDVEIVSISLLGPVDIVG